MKRLVVAWRRLAVLAMCSVLVGQLSAVVTWGPGALSPDCIDDNVEIVGDTLLTNGGGRVTIHAATTDVVVTPTTGNYSVTVGNATVLDLIADAGHTITFDLSQHDLAFRGDNTALLITHSGQGQVIFDLGDGREVRFSHAAEDGIHGTFFLTSLLIGRDFPAVVFKRAAAGNLDASVYIDNYSYVGFVGTDTTLATEDATILFDPTNLISNPLGRLKLVIAEQSIDPLPPAPPVVDFASFSIQGVLNTSANPGGFPYVLGDIDFNTQAGQRANVEIYNSATPTSSQWAGLLVLNNNDAYPILRANPWLEAAPHNVNVQPGFVMGKNGHIQIDDGAYLDYVGGTQNMLEVKEGVVPVVPVIPMSVLETFMVNGNLPVLNTLIKQRNASAFIVDAGSPVLDMYATTYPRIEMLGTSKMYFSSRVDGEDVSEETDFTVDPSKQFTGAAGYGSIVLDVEGRCDISGVVSGSAKTNAINILSTKEANVGGSVDIKGVETNFKLRTFEKSQDGILKQYGKACFLINGRMNLINLILQHTDVIHSVNEKNSPQESEPCYIGGETSYLLHLIGDRPTIAFYNADLKLNTSAALTGVDLLTPSNGEGEAVAPNSSSVYFYYNGWKIDTIGRSLILGTNIGSTAEDLGTVISRAAHFDVWQEFSHPAATIEMIYRTDSNNQKVTEGLTYDITNQFSTHLVYLAHQTNISLGVDAATGTDPREPHDTFTLTSPGRLVVDASYINIESQGGDPLNKPETSIETGQGGIFVDNYGYFAINNTLRLYLSAMVGVGPYAESIIVLPENQVYFNNRVGISKSRLDLSDATQLDIVPVGTIYPDFTLDWQFVNKDYDTWTPYLVPNVVAVGSLSIPTAANIANLPVVHGTVDQMQILNSRAGDPANLIIDGGTIRDLQFILGSKSGENPTGIFVIKGDGRVGLGKYNTVPENRLNMGIDGVTFMPDGNGEVYLTDDIVVHNICHIIAGPNFGIGDTHKLTITSQVPREFRIKSGATLDLSMFDRPERELVIAGAVRLVFEPGSRLIIGSDSATGTGGVLTFTDFSSMSFQPWVQQARPAGTTLTSTDDIRVRISGKGTIQMMEDSYVELPRDAYAGIESAGIAGFNNTAIRWTFEDAARMQIGSETDFGGSLQIGNTVSITGGSVAVTFQLNGPGVVFEVNSQGFLGLGCGIVNKAELVPNEWRIANTYNVSTITWAIDQGTVNVNQIYPGNDPYASLIAFGAVSTGITISSASAFRETQILGGGNIALVNNAGAYINPTVLDTDGTISAELSVGIMASKAVLLDSTKVAPAFPATPANTFAYLKANSYQDQAIKRAELCRRSLDAVTAGYVSTSGTPAVSSIERRVIQGVINIDGSYTDPKRGLEVGVIGMALSPDLIPAFYATRV